MHDPLPSRKRVWWGARLGPVYALFGIGIVLGIVWLWLVMWSVRHDAARVPGPHRRDGAVTLHAPKAGPDRVLLTWEPFAGADRYAVAFYASDRAEIVPPLYVATPTLTLESASLPHGLLHGAGVFYQVVALRGSEPIAKSDVKMVRVP